MYVGFGRFLAGLGVVGLALGVVFGVGIAVGRGQQISKPLAASSTVATGGTAGAGAGGAAAGFGGGAGAGGGAVTGSVDAVSPTSLTVKTATGTTVTLTLNTQTAVRKLDAGTLQDIHAGDEVIATRDASSNATSVQVLPPGTNVGGRALGGGSGTATGSATPSGSPRRGTPTP